MKTLVNSCDAKKGANMTLPGKLLQQCIILSMLVLGGWTMCWAAEAGYQVSDLTFAYNNGDNTAQSFAVTVKGNSTPTFTTYQLFDPLRVVVDIANASLAPGLKLPMDVKQGPVVSVTGKVLTDKKPFIAKLEIMLSEDWPYKIDRQGNDIVISLSRVGMAAKKTAGDKVDEAVKKKHTQEYGIKSIDVKKADGELKVLLVAGGPIEKFTKVELPRGHGRPDRFYLDIPATTAAGLPPIQNVNYGALARIRMAKRQAGTRIVFDSAVDGMFPYEVSTVPRGLLVDIKPVTQQTTPQPANKAQAPAAADKTPVADQDAVSNLLAKIAEQPQAHAPKKQNIVPESKPPSAKEPTDNGGHTAASQLKNVGITGDAFGDAGYDKQKISVDFYKIDLHNVFRLIGEISGSNIVVDDSVNGSLTLALNDVPWDFVLDVVMNLKDLQKEERYNTIVISPKSKNFVWPQSKVKQALEMEAPSDQLQVVIDRQLTRPPEEMTANLITKRADKLLAAGKFKQALQEYEAAYDKWPKNADLAKQIANICLVNLGYNQKAVDYAQKALRINPNDNKAALLAAVGLANMQQDGAMQYFEQSVSGGRPERAALVSYAGYLENKGEDNKGLEILGRYKALYGSDLDTMIARARMLDKLKQTDKAVAEYKAILYSGYGLAPDLAKYIKGRIAAAHK